MVTKEQPFLAYSQMPYWDDAQRKRSVRVWAGKATREDFASDAEWNAYRKRFDIP